MRSILARSALAAACLAPAWCLADPTIVFVTRHAEKASEGKDPDLTAHGQARARMIAGLLHKVGIKQVFSTRTNRTEQTAQPLAKLAGVAVQTYEPARHAALVEKVKASAGPTLIVGHSNTVPELVKLLGGKEVAPMPETEYDRLYQLIIEKDGTVTTLLMNSTNGT